MIVHLVFWLFVSVSGAEDGSTTFTAPLPDPPSAIGDPAPSAQPPEIQAPPQELVPDSPPPEHAQPPVQAPVQAPVAPVAPPVQPHAQPQAQPPLAQPPPMPAPITLPGEPAPEPHTFVPTLPAEAPAAIPTEVSAVPTAVPDLAPIPEASSTPLPDQVYPSKEEDTGTPPYRLVKPQWAFQFAGSLSTYPDTLVPSRLSGTEGEKIVGAQFALDYQPAFLQGSGVWGIGLLAEGNRYPPGHMESKGILGLGVEGRYQAYYAEQQWLVPYVALQSTRLFFNFVGGPSGSATAWGPVYGLSLLLNGFSQKESGEFYDTWGVARSYVFAEMHTAKAIITDEVTLQGRSLFFGLRLEW